MKISRLAPRIALLLAALVAVVAAGCGGADDVPADAVAVVDGTVITKQELTDLLGRAEKSYASQQRDFPKVGTSEYTALQGQAVAYLVQRAQYGLEAEELGIEVTQADIDKRVAEVKKQFFQDDEAVFKKELASQGYTEEAFIEDIKAQLLSEKIFESVTDAVKVSEADAKKYYDENKAQFTTAESREVRHILVKTKAKADDVLRRLNGGESFDALAKELSEDPGSKQDGGKLTIQKGQTVAPFEKSAFSLGVNEVSEPIKTNFGYHIIQALKPVVPAKITPFSEARKQIEARLGDEQKNTAISEWTKELADRYEDKITYAAGYAPPAAQADDGTETTG